MSPTLWLSCHVDYACRHSGVCCRVGWPLPVERRLAPAIDAALTEGRLATVDGARVWLVESAEAPDDMAGTLRQAGGGCVFHQPAGVAPRDGSSTDHPSTSKHCAVHARLGSDVLPSTCRHFPRICLADDRGVRVSLSHVCPTAAAMLVGHIGPLAIVRGPEAVPGLDVPEGLDARGGLPPRLTDRVLMDLDAMSAWEAHVIDVLAGPATWSAPVDDAFLALRTDVERLCRWRPSDGPLVECVRGLAAARDEGRSAAAMATVPEPIAAWRLAASACRLPWTPAPLPLAIDEADARWVAPGWDDAAPIVRRYLAARAFGAWVVWQADAARGLVGWLAMARDVLRVECARITSAAGRPLDRPALIDALGGADRLLVHDADGSRLAELVAARG